MLALVIIRLNLELCNSKWKQSSVSVGGDLCLLWMSTIEMWDVLWDGEELVALALYWYNQCAHDTFGFQYEQFLW